MTSADKMHQALTACRHIIDGIGNEAAAVGAKFKSNSNSKSTSSKSASSATSNRMNMLNTLLEGEMYQDGVVTTTHIGELDIEEAMRYIELSVKKERYSLKYWIDSLSGSQVCAYMYMQ